MAAKIELEDVETSGMQCRGVDHIRIEAAGKTVQEDEGAIRTGRYSPATQAQSVFRGKLSVLEGQVVFCRRARLEYLAPARQPEGKPDDRSKKKDKKQDKDLDNCYHTVLEQLFSV